MRLFIAVPVADNVRERAREVISALRPSGADVKWVEPENLHLTLAFLGATPPEKLPGVLEALARAASRPPFDVVFGPVGAFPSLKDPRVLWLAIEKGAEGLTELARALPSQEERPFSAHLTIGRVRSRKNIDRLERALPTVPAASPAQRADRLVLYESRLTPRGPVYAALREEPFRA